MSMNKTRNAANSLVYRVFRRYFTLIMFLWILLVLYPNPANLVASVQRLISPNLDPAAVASLADGMSSDPQTIENAVIQQVTYSYDWEVYGMPWYHPTVEEVLERGKGDCKARALILASVFEAKNIPYTINWSPIHVWVEYEKKKPTALENNDVKFFQRDPETGKKSLQIPKIPVRDALNSFWRGFWHPMPEVRKVLLVFGLIALLTMRFTWFRKGKGKSSSAQRLPTEFPPTRR